MLTVYGHRLTQLQLLVQLVAQDILIFKADLPHDEHDANIKGWVSDSSGRDDSDVAIFGTVAVYVVPEY